MALTAVQAASTGSDRLSDRAGLTAVTAITPVVWGTTYLVTTELLPPDHPAFGRRCAVRYWDGARWTDHVAPMNLAMTPAYAVQHAATTTVWKLGGGWARSSSQSLAIVIGIMLLSRPGKNAGGWILGISIGLILLVWVSVAAASQPTTYNY